MMKKIPLYPIVTLLATALTLTVNGLANTLPINGQTTGEISDRFAIYFVPAGYVFSIWGLIYLGLIAFAIYQILPAQRKTSLLKEIAPVYWLGSIANAAWILLWHYEYFPLTLVAMLVLLATLLFIYVRISKARPGLDRNQKWFVQLPFSIYLGWISVATIANVSQVLFSAGWNAWGISATAWTAIMLAVATFLGLMMQWRENDNAYVLVLIWAFVGIAIKHADTSSVAYPVWTAVAILALGLLGGILRRRGGILQGA
jgi:hypothetical protein